MTLSQPYGLVGIAAITTAGVLTQVASAAPLAYEGFDLSVGAGIEGKGSGTGWAGNWVDPGTNTDIFNVKAGSLEVAGAAFEQFNNQSTGNRIVGDAGAGVGPISRQLATGAASGETTYFSVTLKTNRTGANEGIYFGVDNQARNPQSWAPVRFGVLRDSTDTSKTRIVEWTGSAWEQRGPVFGVDLGDPLLLVYSFDGATDQTQYWVNPTQLGGAAPLADATGSQPISTFDWVNFAGTWNNWEIDEVRVGGSFAEVTPVPEPASFACTAAGMLLMTWRRR